MMFNLPKPPHGAPCNNCGRCCKDQICPLGQRIFGKPWLRQCPALIGPQDEGVYVCELVAHPDHYIAAMPSEVADLSAAAGLLLGAGLGCDCLDFAHERPNLRWRRETKSKLLKLTNDIQAAKLLWGWK